MAATQRQEIQVVRYDSHYGRRVREAATCEVRMEASQGYYQGQDRERVAALSACSTTREMI